MPEKELTYCPYTDKDIEASAANIEHIFPLSLGGSNSFVIKADAEFNSRVGSKVDGALANDFLVLGRRIKMNARGHTKKRPVARTKSASMENRSRPIQVEFFGPEGMKIYDPVLRRELSTQEISGKTLNLNVQLTRYGRLKFAAKVALSAGLFVFGDWFRENVAHEELRILLNFDNATDEKELSALGLRAYDELNPVSERDREEHQILEYICGAINGSCVFFVPGPVNLGVTVGVLGKYVASLNIPANTDQFPFSEQNDLGHAVVLEGGKMERLSYRQLLAKALEHISQQAKSG